MGNLSMDTGCSLLSCLTFRVRDFAEKLHWPRISHFQSRNLGGNVKEAFSSPHGCVAWFAVLASEPTEFALTSFYY